MSTKNLFNYDAPADLLAGKNILITGAGAGIGRATALACAEHGATTILLGRSQQGLEETYDQICAAGLPEPAIYVLDLMSEDLEVYAAMRDVMAEHFGQLHGLVHCASVLGERKPLADYTPKAWQQVMQINVSGAFLLTRALLPLLLDADQASIIFTSSSVGRKGRAYWGAYAISKFATEGMMETWADELENISNVTVNSINPGATDTAMRRAAYPAEDPANNCRPADIAPLYLYLLGRDGAKHNGERFDAQPK
jgi:NAD(P)-dependent dehydrogenase (short-subunit alcohol dehydrogenase family)